MVRHFPFLLNTFEYAIYGKVQSVLWIISLPTLLAVIEPLIQTETAKRILNLSPYSPDFNPIELWWSQVKAFLGQLSPTTSTPG